MTIIKSLNGELVQMTNEEEISFLAEIEKSKEQFEIRQEEEQAKIDAKASALAKLSALGLTEEEVQAIIK
jgi:hypothetical protein